MTNPRDIKPQDCPEPYWHETHRYCPACSWTENYGKPIKRPITVDIKVDESAMLYEVGDSLALGKGIAIALRDYQSRRARRAGGGLVTTVPMIGTTFGIDTPRARRSDPETSHEAADTNDVEASIGAVLDTLRQYGPTTDEKLVNLMASLGFPWTEQRIRTARAALVNAELVEFTGEQQINAHNRKARVWAATNSHTL